MSWAYEYGGFTVLSSSSLPGASSSSSAGGVVLDTGASSKTVGVASEAL